jgi:hypothetical protein
MASLRMAAALRSALNRNRRLRICAPSVRHLRPDRRTDPGRAIPVFRFLEPNDAPEPSAGGGTRTPDTRIMIPHAFSSVEPKTVEMAHGWRTNVSRTPDRLRTWVLIFSTSEKGQSGKETSLGRAGWGSKKISFAGRNPVRPCGGRGGGRGLCPVRSRGGGLQAWPALSRLPPRETMSAQPRPCAGEPERGVETFPATAIGPQA